MIVSVDYYGSRDYERDASYPACSWNTCDCPYINFEPFEIEAPYTVVNSVEEEDIAI